MSVAVLLRLAASIGVPDRFRRIAAIGFAALFTMLICALLYFGVQRAIGHHDDTIRKLDRAGGIAASAQADRVAGAAKDARDDEFRSHQSNLEDLIDASPPDNGTALDSLSRGMRR
ncbi:MAG: hypothetical protein OSB00_15250 [Sphingomonas bacterium]|nr:hypothetical protein [Sphingomonas bacterium]